MKQIIYSLLILLLSSISVFSQTDENKLQINGFVDTYHAVRVKSPNDFMSSRTRVRGELQKTFGKSSMFVSFNLNQNSILKEQTGFELREAYFDYSAEHWSLRAGRQLIIWGAADGMRITDLVSPMDLTEFLARDYDDIRMPVEALKFRYFNDFMKAELVYIPIFKGFVLPTDKENPWTTSLFSKAEKQEEQKPDKTLKNSEIGGRLTFNLPGIDFSLAALYTYNKMPTFSVYQENNNLLVHKTYHRMTFVGGDFSKPFGQFVARGEAAFNFNKFFETKQFSQEAEKHNALNYLVGLDWFAPNEWFLSVQFSDEVIFNYSEELLKGKTTPLLTFNVSKNLLNSTLKLSNFMYTDLDNSGFFNRFSADYSLTDQIHLFVGYDHFQGDKGNFGVYKNNSEVWVKAKYSF